MQGGPNIARIAALVGDVARANVLTALLDGRALTATELAQVARVSKPTISAHLSKLREAGLIAMTAQGRHRYFRLADDEVAQLLEAMQALAGRATIARVATGPRDPGLRKARVCYDHLAGEMGVHAYDAMRRRRWLREDVDGLALTRAGEAWLARLGIDPASLRDSRRLACRPCLDWGERRFHLAGVVGARLLDHVFAQGWARRARGGRTVIFTVAGERAFLDCFAARG
jgi:DNA-binding transcriptional ArsR family regulator